jgi:hypothetical protein
MRSCLTIIVCALVLGACGGDYDVATAELVVTQTTEESPGPRAVPPANRDPRTQPPSTGEPAADATEYDVNLEDAWDPEWTEHDDPAVEGCLKMFPAICDKVAECTEDIPLLNLVSGYCPVAFDAMSPLLEMGCDEIAKALKNSMPDIPLVGDSLGTMITDMLRGCIENFTCDLDYILALGEKLGAVAGLISGSADPSQMTDALPQLLELAEMCGGIDGLLPF